jgi:hypothetical protein
MPAKSPLPRTVSKVGPGRPAGRNRDNAAYGAPRFVILLGVGLLSLGLFGLGPKSARLAAFGHFMYMLIPNG